MHPQVGRPIRRRARAGRALAAAVSSGRIACATRKAKTLRPLVVWNKAASPRQLNPAFRLTGTSRIQRELIITASAVETHQGLDRVPAE